MICACMLELLPIYLSFKVLMGAIMLCAVPFENYSSGAFFRGGTLLIKLRGNEKHALYGGEGLEVKV
jgi:hypothetical protein